MADIRKLPPPLVATWEWQLRGACRDTDSEVFFHPERERGIDRINREMKAQQVCRGCAVIAECRSHALSVEEPYGVWGGLTEHDRNRIVQERRAASRARHLAAVPRGA